MHSVMCPSQVFGGYFDEWSRSERCRREQVIEKASMQDELRRAADAIPGLVSETLLAGEKRLLEMVASGR